MCGGRWGGLGTVVQGLAINIHYLLIYFKLVLLQFSLNLI